MGIRDLPFRPFRDKPGTFEPHDGSALQRDWLGKRSRNREAEAGRRAFAERATPHELVEAIDGQWRERFKNVRREMRLHDMDVLVVSQTPDVLAHDYAYLDSRERPRALKKDGVLLVSPTEVRHVDAPSPTDAGSHTPFSARFVDALAELSPGGFPEKVGIETSITGSLFEEIKESMPHGASIAVEPVAIVAEARREKSLEEVELMDRGQTALEKFMREVLPGLMYEGMSELELAEKVERAITEAGTVPTAFPAIVAFGEDSAVPHHRPRADRILKNGEPALVDCGMVFMNRVCTDMTRTYWFGGKEGALWEEFEQDYTILEKLQAEAAERYIAGAKTKDADDFVHQRLGNMPHSLGHGIAQASVHAKPTVSQRSGEEFRTGDVASNEPGIYKEGKYGIRIEDVIAVTPRGSRVFAAGPSRSLIAIPRRSAEARDHFSMPPLGKEKDAESVRRSLETLKKHMGNDVDIYIAAKTEDASSRVVEMVCGFKGTHGYIVLVRSPESQSIESYFVTDGRYASDLARWGEQSGFFDCMVIGQKTLQGTELKPLTFEDILTLLFERNTHGAHGKHAAPRIACEKGMVYPTEAVIESALRKAGVSDPDFSRVVFAELSESDVQDEEGTGGETITAFLDPADEPRPLASFIDPDDRH